ncbi:FAD dependent oxidoreductase [Pyrenochaeta sp. MPI-SDFR-AT-0127]|nr:FAD dependent oxidoreductase [Pyrenochaeta sp. MPI-SDFR-AT-0127]
MTMPDSSPSILIVGAGVFGTSAAYHLSLTHPCPSKITVLDRSPFPPHHAASTDINKIVRADYTSRFYMDLAYEALEAWKTWPVLQDHEESDVFERIRKNFRDRGSDDTSDIAIDVGLRSNWQGILSEVDLEEPTIAKGYWNPKAGWADAAKAMQRLMEAATSRGVKYDCGDVDRLVLADDGVRGVKTQDGRIYEADKVLLATGAWTSELLSPIEDELRVSDEDRVEKQVTAAVIVYGDRGEIIPPPADSHLLKFTHSRSFTNTTLTPSSHKVSVPPSGPQTSVPLKLQQETLDCMIKKTMPNFASRTPDYWRLCWDAITPSQDQLMTRHPHPQLGNLFLAVGGSFHSWKFLPTIGKYIANVLHGVSNGEERDKRWQWKTAHFEGRGAHEHVVPKRELSDLTDA